MVSPDETLKRIDGTFGFTLVSCFRFIHRTAHHPHDDLEGGGSRAAGYTIFDYDRTLPTRSKIFPRVPAWVWTRIDIVTFDVCDVCVLRACKSLCTSGFRPRRHCFLSGSGLGRRDPNGLVPSFDTVLVIVTICYLSIMGSVLVSRLPSEVGYRDGGQTSFCNSR